jgi:hypothetical protein
MIAVASLELAEDNHMSMPELFVNLVKAALTVGKRKYVEGYDDYVILSRVFEKDRPDIAIAVAEAVYDDSPDFLANVYNLGRVLLMSKKYEACSAVYRKASSRLIAMRDREKIATSLRRVYYFEWGNCENRRGHVATSAWLKAASVADLDGSGGPRFCSLEEMDQDHIERALTAIGANLLDLYGKDGQVEYLEAASAVITLTRRLALSPNGDRALHSVEQRVGKSSLTEFSGSAAKLLFRAGVRLAFEARECDLPAVPVGGDLCYAQLFKILGV